MLKEKKSIDYFEHLVAPDKAGDFLSIFENVLNKTPYNLVRLKVNGGDELQIQVMAEREDKSMIIEDCKKLAEKLDDSVQAISTVAYSAPHVVTSSSGSAEGIVEAVKAFVPVAVEIGVVVLSANHIPLN